MKALFNETISPVPEYFPNFSKFDNFLSIGPILLDYYYLMTPSLTH